MIKSKMAAFKIDSERYVATNMLTIHRVMVHFIETMANIVVHTSAIFRFATYLEGGFL
jgi:hypothetical protein